MDRLKRSIDRSKRVSGRLKLRCLLLDTSLREHSLAHRAFVQPEPELVLVGSLGGPRTSRLALGIRELGRPCSVCSVDQGPSQVWSAGSVPLGTEIAPLGAEIGATRGCALARRAQYPPIPLRNTHLAQPRYFWNEKFAPTPERIRAA